jgi:outer membrane receptor protein involved in Fe transport
MATVAVVAVASPAQAQDARRPFNIPAQPLTSALEAFGRQSGKAILFSRDQTRARVSASIGGALSPDAALDRLLAGSGLVARRPTASAYVVEPVAQPRTAGERAADPGAQIESLVVTATKRAERLLDVPLAVSAVTRDGLARQTIGGNEDLSRIVPSLYFTQLSPGENSLSLRGLTSGYGLFPTVAFYVDETPLDMRQDAKSGTPSIDMFDVARVEVLRGPQGTLFGSGSLGGTVRMVMNQPEQKAFEAKAEAGLTGVGGGGVGHAAKLVLNAPLGQHLAVRVAAAQTRSGGFTDIVRPSNYYVVSPADPVIATDANPSDQASVRIAAAWTPQPGWSVTPSLYLQRVVAHGYNQADADRAAYTYARGFTETNTNKLLVGNLLIRKTTPWAEIVSSSAYTYKNQDSFEDYSAWVARRYAALTGQRAAVPFFATDNYQTNIYYQYTHELRLSSVGQGPLSWIAGLYYSSLKQKERQAISSPGYGAYYAARVGAANTPVLIDYQAPALDRQAAAFADATYRPTRRIEVSVGARVYELRQRIQIFQGGLMAGVSVPPNASRRSGVNPRVNLKFKPGDSASLYLSASKGFRPGGANTAQFGNQGVCALQDIYNRFYEPDSVWNYEGGAKVQLLDRKLTINSAVYQIDWRNIQGSLPSNCGTFIANFGSARIRGVEAEVYWKVGGRLAFNASASFNEAQFVSLKPGVPAALSIAVGRRLINTPKVKWAAGGEYSFTGPWRSDGYARATVQHVGATPTSYTNPTADFLRPAYTNVDATLGAFFGRTEVQLYVENLFDRYEVVGIVNSQLQTYPVAFLAPPRTFGASVRRQF